MRFHVIRFRLRQMQNQFSWTLPKMLIRFWVHPNAIPSYPSLPLPIVLPYCFVVNGHHQIKPLIHSFILPSPPLSFQQSLHTHTPILSLFLKKKNDLLIFHRKLRKREDKAKGGELFAKKDWQQFQGWCFLSPTRLDYNWFNAHSNYCPKILVYLCYLYVKWYLYRMLYCSIYLYHIPIQVVP